MQQILFRGTYWNGLRTSNRIFSPGEDIVDPDGEVTFQIRGGTMRVVQKAGKNQLFFTNQSVQGQVLGTAVLFVRFNGFLTRHVHITVTGGDPVSVTPLGIAINYTNNPNLLYFGTSVPDDPRSPGSYDAVKDISWGQNRMAAANIAFLTDKSENRLREFSYSVDAMLQRTVDSVRDRVAWRP